MLQEKSIGRIESKSCFRTRCGEGSFEGKFCGMPVGRVPLERGFQDSLWEVPEETPGGGAAQPADPADPAGPADPTGKKKPSTTIFFRREIQKKQ